MVWESWFSTYAVEPSGLIRTCEGKSPTGNGAESTLLGKSARTADAFHPCVMYATLLRDIATANGCASSGWLSLVASEGCVLSVGAGPVCGVWHAEGGGGGSSCTKLTQPYSLGMIACVPDALNAM